MPEVENFPTDDAEKMKNYLEGSKKNLEEYWKEKSVEI